VLYEGEKSAKPTETCKESADTKHVPVTGKFYRSASVKKVIVCTQTFVRVSAVGQANQNTSEATLCLSCLSYSVYSIASHKRGQSLVETKNKR
jgi:hypothetical protein